MSSTYLHHIANFGPLAAEIDPVFLGIPANFNGLRVLAARHSSIGRQPNFAALNRGRHVRSAGRPSRLALAHFLVSHKTVGPILSDRCPVCLSVCLSLCPVCLSCLSVSNVGVLWLNGWMDQDGTLHGGGPWSKPHCARWGPSSPPPKRLQSPPNFWSIFIVAKRRQ